jgi:hypothetical protein
LLCAFFVLVLVFSLCFLLVLGRVFVVSSLLCFPLFIIFFLLIKIRYTSKIFLFQIYRIYWLLHHVWLYTSKIFLFQIYRIYWLLHHVWLSLSAAISMITSYWVACTNQFTQKLKLIGKGGQFTYTSTLPLTCRLPQAAYVEYWSGL